MNSFARIIFVLVLLAPSVCAQTQGFVRPDVMELCLASKLGDQKTVERLIAAETPLDHTDSEGQQPIVKAITGEHFRVLLTLLKGGADPDVRTRNAIGSTALTIAAGKADLRMVEALVDAGADPNLRGRSGATPLGIAAREGAADIVAFLLKHGADPNGWTALDTLGRQYTPLFTAADMCHPKIVKMLLANGARVDQHLSNGDPALTIAAAKANKQVLEQLVAAGANIDALTPSGATPLIIAIEHQNREAVRFLLENGADPRVKVSTYKGKPCTAREYAKTINNRYVISMVEQVVEQLDKK